MPFSSRIFLYCLLGGAAFFLGRVVFPSAGSALHPEQLAAMHQKALAKYWQDKVQAALVEPAPEKALEPLLAKMTAEDFPAVAEAFVGNDAARSRLAERWGIVDPAGGFKYLANSDLRSSGAQQMACQLVSGWARKDFVSAEAAASRLRVAGTEPDPMKSLGIQLLRNDIKKGLAYLQQKGLTLSDEIMLHELQVSNAKSERWQGATVEQRIDFLQAQPESAWKEAALEELYAILLKGNPADLLRAIQVEGKRLGLAAPAAEAWVKADQDGSALFFQTEAKDQVKVALGLAMARQYSQKDPGAAWEFVQTNLSGKPRAIGKMVVMAAQTERDPTVAARWLKDIPESPWRTEALINLNKFWTTLDAAAAAQWRSTDLTPQDLQSLEQKP